jgi:hypothetical protein
MLIIFVTVREIRSLWMNISPKYLNYRKKSTTSKHEFGRKMRSLANCMMLSEIGEAYAITLVSKYDYGSGMLNFSLQAVTIERREWSDLREDLERKLADAQNLNNSLQSELNKLRTDNASMEKDLRDQRDRASTDDSSGGQGGEWKRRFESLENDHEELKMELREQQQVIPRPLYFSLTCFGRPNGLHVDNRGARTRWF